MSLNQVGKRIYCYQCHWYSFEYSVEELSWDFGFLGKHGFHKSYTNYCIRCYSFIYARIATQTVQNQRLECLMNKSHYWGIVASNYGGCGFKFALKNPHLGDVIWWEFPKPDAKPGSYGDLVLAITNLKDRRENLKSYNFSEIERHTTFIHRELNAYCVDITTNAFYGFFSTRHDPLPFRSSIDEDQSRRCYFTSLQNAIDYVENSHLHRFHIIAGESVCDCKKMSRFNYKNTVSTQVVRNVWSLQKLSAFFIRQYCYHNKREIFRLTHRICRDIILSANAIEME
jgi:hypothetical protein